MQVFFYGLFMDQEILSKNGVHATNPRKGYLNHFALKIGNRASLVSSDNERAYGILMEVDDDEINQLYAEESVADYIPEEVEVITEDNDHINAICYNLPIEQLSGTNPSYAQSLFELAKKLEFPNSYLDKINN